MRPILIILIFFSGTVLSRYHEKRRFDRSISDNHEARVMERNSWDKQWSFTDHETRFTAYKDKKENSCYLQRLEDRNSKFELSKNGSPQERQESNILYASITALTKLEAWRIAGGRIVDYCHGRNIVLLQNTKPTPQEIPDPFLNEIPLDENDIVTRRIADVVLTPLISRTKRHIILEERRKLNENAIQTRSRRQTQQPRGRFRGQTQSQYLSLGSDDQKEGKAEAEATHESSRAIVSGSRGMGQAQSMSSGGNGCEDCPRYPVYPRPEPTPDRYTKPSGSVGTGTQGAIFPGGRIVYPGGSMPPGGIPPTTGVLPGNKPGGDIHSTGIPSTPSTGGAGNYPGVFPGIGQPGGAILYPNTIIPRTTITAETYRSDILAGTIRGGGVPYPGGVVPGTTGTGDTYPGGRTEIGRTRPGTIGTYPGDAGGTGGTYSGGITTGTGGTYSGGTTGGTRYPGGTTGTGGTYPGGTTTGTGGNYPESTRGTGGSYPGGVTTGIGGTYPGGAPGADGRYPGGTYPRSSTTATSGTYPMGIIAGTGGVYPGAITSGSGGIYPGGSTTGTGGIYPGGTTGTGGTYPGGTTTGSRGIYPGGTTTGTGGTYSEGTTTGTGGTYPGGTATGTAGTYLGGTTTGTGTTYAGGTTAGTGTTYPGRTTTGTGGIYHGGMVTYPNNVLPGTVPGRGGTIYPGAIVPGTYPGDITQGTVGGRYPGVVIPGTVQAGQGVMYPVGIRGPEFIHGRIVTGSTATADSAIYPGSHVPGTGFPGGGGTYPFPVSTGQSDVTGGTIVYPGRVQPGTTSGGPTSGTGGTVTHPGGIPTPPAQSGGSVMYPGGTVPGSTIGGDARSEIVTSQGETTYPGGVMPGSTVTGRGQTYHGGVGSETVTVDRIPYPGGSTPGIGDVGTYPGHATGSGTGTMISYPGISQPTGQIIYPPGIQPGSGGVQPGISYPPGVRPGDGITQTTYPGSPGQYPISRKYPDGREIISEFTPGYPIQQGQYPGGGQGPTDTAGRGDVQYPGGGQGIRGQYSEQQYHGGSKTGETSQYYQKPGDYPPSEDDGSNSQASSSVKQIDSGTQASASAQGKFGQGTSQSQITGTYSGTGSFSAQAGSSDANKNAQTEVSGGKEGAISSAQGSGGYGKSQAQVQLDSESGATSTGAQSNGWNHGTNSQVQASSKGGMADAQANGEGSTSSQAQIGFHPYLKTDEKVERHSRPFRGGGTASAQSGTYRGQSQSQLEGSFQYGITYTGAAQAGSGSGAAASRKPFNFSATDTELFKPFKPYGAPTISKDSGSEATNTSADVDDQDDLQKGLQASSSSRKTVVVNTTKEDAEISIDKVKHSDDKSRLDDTMYDVNGDYDEEYDNNYDSSLAQIAINPKGPTDSHTERHNNRDHQSQSIHLATGNPYDVRINQESNAPQAGDLLQPGQSLPGYTVPAGFRGRITSIAGGETIAQGNGKSQSQTVALTPTGPNVARENKSPISETRSLQTNHERLAEHQNSYSGNRNQPLSTEYSKSTSMPIKPSYYTVTNSVAGKIDGSKNSPRKYEHRYYTKSSTCGYFTFSCNIVYGSNGRTKICKPKIPTYPDGTPMKC